MARKKPSPLAQAMVLFSLMDERDRATLAEYVKLVTATPRRLPKQEPVKKGKTTEPVCWTCGNPADASGHDLRYISSHPFVQSAGKKSSRKGAGKVSIPITGEETEPVSVVGASAGGD